MASSTIETTIVLNAKDHASKTIAGIGDKLGDMGKAATIALAGMATAAVGFAATAVKAAADEEVGMKQLAQAARNAGVDWEQFGKTTEKQITAWQTLSSVADSDIRPAFALLIAQTGSLEEATKRMPIALDLSRGANIDLAMATKLLGKMTDENVNVFKKMGLTFDENSTQAEVLAAVQAKFSGQASEYAATAAGAWQGFQNDFGDVVEEIGLVLLPLFKTGMETVRGFVAAFSEGGGLAGVKDMFLTIAGILGELFRVISGQAPDAGAKLKEIVGPGAASEIMNGLATIRDAFKAAFQFIQDNVLPPIREAFKFLSENWESTSFAMKAIALTVVLPMFAAWTAAAILAAATTIIAFAPVILAIAAVGTAAFLMHKVWTENLGGVQSEAIEAGEILGAVFSGIGSIVRETVDNAVDAFHRFTDLIGFMQNVGQDIVNGLRDGISRAWGSVTSKIRELVNMIPEAVRKLLGISSPSKVMARIGTDIVGGLAKGINDTAPLAIGAMQGLATTLVGEANATAAAVRGALSSQPGAANTPTGLGTTAGTTPITNAQLAQAQFQYTVEASRLTAAGQPLPPYITEFFKSYQQMTDPIPNSILFPSNTAPITNVYVTLDSNEMSAAISTTLVQGARLTGGAL